MRKVLVFCALIFTLIACEKKETEQETVIITNRPEIPKNDSIDINSDGLTDFVIIYQELSTTDQPSSGGSIIGSLLSLDQNNILSHSQTGFLFLQPNDTIKNENNSNSNWTNHRADLLNIGRNENTWNNTWEILSEQNSDHYIGIKLINNSIESIGWILVEIDTISGKISLVESRLTDSAEIILD